MFKQMRIMVSAAILLTFSAGFTFADSLASIIGKTSLSETANVTQSSISPVGRGDSLLYGYYNVRGNLNFFKIVNTSDKDGAKVRFVFRNAENGKQCLSDLSVCLSKGDMWSAYLIDNGTTAVLCPFDTDTTTSPSITPACLPFKYEGTGGRIGVTADDCREGYFEAVGMSAIPAYHKDTCTANSTTCPKTEDYCKAFDSGLSVDNVLIGDNEIFGLTTKLPTFAYNAVAVADTSTGSVPTPTGEDDISIAKAMDKGCDEADYIFTRSDIIAPYNTMSDIGGETETIVTFPTRLPCHNSTSDPLFDSFGGTASDPRYCTKIDSRNVWNDKEQKQEFSEFATSFAECVPFVVNMHSLGSSRIWNSRVKMSFYLESDFELGWLKIDLDPYDEHHTHYGDQIIYGLPSVSYYTQSYLNDATGIMRPAF